MPNIEGNCIYLLVFGNVFSVVRIDVCSCSTPGFEYWAFEIQPHSRRLAPATIYYLCPFHFNAVWKYSRCIILLRRVKKMSQGLLYFHILSKCTCPRYFRTPGSSIHGPQKSSDPTYCISAVCPESMNNPAVFNRISQRVQEAGIGPLYAAHFTYTIMQLLVDCVTIIGLFNRYICVIALMMYVNWKYKSISITHARAQIGFLELKLKYYFREAVYIQLLFVLQLKNE